MNPNRKNLANAFLAAPITAAATTMTYQAGYGAGKPAVPYFDTLTPQGQLSTMGNSEIVEVTALSGDTATIVRARKGTTAKAFPAGTIASNGIYTDDKYGSDNIDWATFYPFVYSATERRVGTWIDGKPLYRRSYVVPSLANATSTNVPHGLSGVAFRGAEAFTRQKSGGNQTSFVLPSGRPDGLQHQIGLWLNDTNITIIPGSDRTGYEAYVHIYYTKNSD